MKCLSALFLLLFAASSAYCQKDITVFYNKMGKAIDSTSAAVSYDQARKMTDTVSFLEHYNIVKGKGVHVEDDRKMKKVNDSTFLIFAKITSATDTIHRIIRKENSGYLIRDYQNKFLLTTGHSRYIIPLVKEGQWKNYFKSTDKIKSIEEYADNQLLSNQRWKLSGEEDLSNVYPVAEVDPEFPGGQAKLVTFLSSAIKYPGKSRRHNEQGVVTAQFIVKEDGTISDAEILKGVSKSLDAESIRVIQSMPVWKPGTINGKPVNVTLQVPFKYSIPKK